MNRGLLLRRAAVTEDRPATTAALILKLVAGVSGCAGLLVAVFCLYLFAFSGVQEYHAQHDLAGELGGPAGLAALDGKTPAQGQPALVLKIPALGLRQIVVEGTSAKDLESGPGLMIGSAPAGTAGDVVIAGRRTTFGSPFARLGTLRPGDVVEVTGALGPFRYEVTKITVVRSGEVIPAGPTVTGRLTLVTSTPAYDASSLLVAEARLVGRPVARVPTTAAALPAPSFGLGGDSGAALPAVVLGEAFVAALAGAVFFVRRSRRTWLVYALAAPIVLAIGLLWFENVAALLPATL